MDPIIVITKYSMNHLWRTVTAVLLKFYENFAQIFVRKNLNFFTCVLLMLQPLKLLNFESSSTFLQSLLMQRVGDYEKAWKILTN